MDAPDRPKMIVDCHVFDKEFQGVQTYLLSLYSGIIGRQTGFEFIFVAKNTDRLRQLIGTAHNFHFVKARFSNLLLRLNIDFPAIARKFRATHAHFQHIIPFRRPFKTIVTVHDLLVFDFPHYFPRRYRLLRKFFFSYSIRHADWIVAVSNYTRDRLRERFQQQQHRMAVIRNAVRDFPVPAIEASRGIVNDKFGLQNYILCVSRHEPRKNQSSLLRAYLDMALHRKHLHLVFVGHKSITDREFESLLASSGDAVRYIHQIEEASNELLPHLYRAAQVMVYPSFAEGFGLPPLEAALLRVPVICSNATAMSEYIFFSRTHVNPAITREICSALAEIIANPPQEQQLSEIADKVRLAYDQSGQTEQHITFLRQLAS